MPPIEPIRTKRLLLREFQASDRDALLAFVRDPSQIEHMLFFLDTEEQLDAFLAACLQGVNAEPRLDWHLAVEELSTGRCLGSVCLMVESDSTTQAELGYWFLRESWGKGYATEASLAALELGFLRLGYHRVWGKCHVVNAASARILQKLGMTYEGTLREHVWLRDHFRSSHIYGMLKSEYDPGQLHG